MSKFFTEGWSDFTTTLKRTRFILRQPMWWVMLCVGVILNWFSSPGVLPLIGFLFLMYAVAFAAFYMALRKEKNDRTLRLN